jgi:hypothetical protein
MAILKAMGTWPLVARESELDTIRASLASGSGQAGVLIVGPPGVGKTRLAEEAVAAVDRRTVLRFVGTLAAQCIPLAPALAVVPGLSGAPDQVIMKVHAELAARRPPALLLVDDVQWLDSSTQTLVHGLIRARGVRVVATARDDLPIPPTILHLWQDGLLGRVDLAPLAPAESARLVDEIVGVPVEAAAVAALHARSGGLPLALRELVAEARACHALVVEDGLGRMVAPLPPPRHLLEVIAGNLERTQPAWRDILGVVAIAEPVPMDLILRIVAADLLTAAEKEGLVRLGGSVNQMVTVGHPLYGDAARASLTPLARRHILERLVDGAAGLSDGNDALMLRRAAWCLELGRPVQVDGLLRATRLTHRALDAGLAASFARALWRERPEFDTGILYATTLVRQQRYEPAHDILRTVAGLAATEEQLVTRASMANEVLARLGRFDDAVAELLRAEATVHSGRHRAHLTTRRAFTTSLSGRTRAGLDIIAPVMDSPEDAEFREAMLFAPSMLALDGRTDHALALVARAERLEATAAVGHRASSRCRRRC